MSEQTAPPVTILLDKAPLPPVHAAQTLLAEGTTVILQPHSPCPLAFQPSGIWVTFDEDLYWHVPRYAVRCMRQQLYGVELVQQKRHRETTDQPQAPSGFALPHPNGFTARFMVTRETFGRTVLIVRFEHGQPVALINEVCFQASGSAVGR